MTDNLIETIARAIEDESKRPWDETIGKHPTAFRCAQAALTALSSAGYTVEKGWQPIDKKPSSDMAVLVYFANMVWRDRDGNIVAPNSFRDPVERTQSAFYQGGVWCESGTAHDLFEDWRGPEATPTHWKPLPAPTAMLAAEETE